MLFLFFAVRKVLNLRIPVDKLLFFSVKQSCPCCAGFENAFENA
jgi:hypothetical protein